MPAAPLQPPPRTCAIFSMSTSEASCHGRELSRAVTRRELTAEARRRPGKALRCFPSFFPGCRPVRARARSKLFCKKVSSKNFTLATARPPPRTCAILSMSTSGSELPLARIESPGTGPFACPWCFPHLSSSGTYFWSTGKARYAGRIIRPPVVSSSMRWAHQPAMRLTANMGVNKSSGMPSISYTSPE